MKITTIIKKKTITQAARFLIPCITTTALFGCGGGTGYVPVTSTTNATPGTLLSSTVITSYPTSSLSDYLFDQICLPDTSADDCNSNQSNLESNYNFNLSQIESYTAKVDAYALTYSSPGIFNENRLLSGGVLIPDMPTDQLKGVILYYHPTAITKSDVPSCFGGNGFDMPNYCQASSLDGQTTAAILASQGYIVVMPDYVGQGIDYTVMHPYTFYPQNNAENGINMLTATRAFLTQLDLPESYSLNLYVTGVSEGGAYALWTTKLAQTDYANTLTTDGFNLTSTASISGAYDLINAQMPMETDNVNEGDNSQYNILNTFNATTAKPVLMAYALTSYGFYSLNQTYDTVMNQAFFDCLTCQISGNNYNLASLFNTPNLDTTSIRSYILTDASLTGYGLNGDNSVKALTASNLENNSAFTAQLTQASLTSFNSTTPISLLYLAKDSVVTNLNSVNAYNGISSASPANTVTADILDNSLYKYFDNTVTADAPIDHLQSTPFMLIAALSAFKESGAI